VPALYAVTDLGTLGGSFADPSDLNQAGQVVGFANTSDGFNHAFLWDNGTMIDLGTLGGSHSFAYGINDLGQVVGRQWDASSGVYQAYLWTPDLPNGLNRTADGTAKAGEDYVGKTGTLTFAPGETTKTITIVVNGDSKKEADEMFSLDLFGNSSSSLFTRKRGLGTILNDD
jgi:probable HAF family extracellular repeat protein